MIEDIIEYLYIILLIINCNTIYSTCISKDLHISEISIALMGVMCIIIFFNKKEKVKIKKSGVMLLTYYYIYIIIFIAFNKILNIQNFISNYIAVLPLNLIIFSELNQKRKRKILSEFFNIVVIISIISLILYTMGSTLNIIKPTNEITISWGKARKINTYWWLQANIQKNGKIWRNTGFFAEAPMFSLILIIALAIELFILENREKSKEVILIITTMTTFSATGLSLICLMYIIKIIVDNRKKSNSVIQILKFIITPIIIVMIVGIGIKVLSNKLGTASYIVRVDDFKACYNVWRMYPIFGAGYGNVDKIIENMSSFRETEKGLSNSLGVSFAENGIYLNLIYLFAFFRTIKYGKKSKKIGIIIFAFIIMILFVTTIFMFSHLFMILIAMGITNKREDLKEKKV